MLTGAFISAAIAMELPGPGTIYLGQTLQFRAPVTLGDTLTVALEVTDKHASRSGFTPLKTATALKLMTTVSRKSEVATTSTSSTTAIAIVMTASSRLAAADSARAAAAAA